MGKPKQWLGLDIGGANLKAAMTNGYARHASFALWKEPAGLAESIATLIADAPPHAGLAVTMTGELADCYATKARGVASIVAAVEQAAAGESTQFFSTRRAFLTAGEAVERWPEVAAANWFALALACNTDMLIDVGSTTTDIIGPGFEDRPKDDTSRLLTGELLYQGVGRTPICAVVTELPYRGQMCPVASELFATTLDMALLLDYATPSDSIDTADGRPATKANAVARLGRMLCADMTQFNEDDALVAARHVCDQMERRLCDAFLKSMDGRTHSVRSITFAGEGDWIARAALLRLGYTEQAHSLRDQIGAASSRCAPAWAVAKLQDEWSQS